MFGRQNGVQYHDCLLFQFQGILQMTKLLLYDREVRTCGQHVRMTIGKRLLRKDPQPLKHQVGRR